MEAPCYAARPGCTRKPLDGPDQAANAVAMTSQRARLAARWKRRWTIDAGEVTLLPVTRAVAQEVLDGGPITDTFEQGVRHAMIDHAMDIAIQHADSGGAAVMPAVWFVVRNPDGRVVGDMGTHGPPDSEGCVEIGYSLAPSARGQGIGSAAVAALIERLATVPGIRAVTAVTGADNLASRRLLERLGFLLADFVPGANQVRYLLNLA